MSWQKSVAKALRDLKAEETRLTGELAALRRQIASLGGVAGSAGAGRGRRRKLSATARAAISRAAKKRWAKYRAEKAATS
jgi:Arc/MetJ-type ribon-helix-helix transcriptional regulator